jgi:hypothetical protein
VVQAILAGERLDENRWNVDGPSGCLVPAGKAGPFRTSVRWSAAVDRLTGVSERHSMACIEFRPGAGLWTIAGFASDAARDTWQDAVKASFRLLADTGFGGERSRGWGRSLAPEFIEGELPGLILGEARPGTAGLPAGHILPEAPEPTAAAEVAAPPMILPLKPPAPEPAAEAAPAEPVAEALAVEPPSPEGPAPEPAAAEAAPAEPVAEALAVEPPSPGAPAPEPAVAEAAPAGPVAEPAPQAAGDAPASEPVAPEPPTPKPPEPIAAPAAAPARTAGGAHWLLSLFVPAAADSVDWSRGSYTVMARGGRVESPAGSGGLKKQIQMIAEGSVVVAPSTLLGAAPDVAPDGFAHPVFRAGFALSIPLPEGN